jgi:hypothetical protein
VLSLFLGGFLLFFCVLTFVTGVSSLKQTVSGPIPPLFMGMICWSLPLLEKICSHDFLMVSCCFLWVLTIWSGFSFLMQIISWPILPPSFMRIYWLLSLLEKVSSEVFLGQFFAIFEVFWIWPPFHTVPSFLIDISCSSEQILSLADSLVLCGLGSGKFYAYFGSFWFSDPFMPLNLFYFSFIGIPCSPELIISFMDEPNVLSGLHSGKLVTFLMVFSLFFTISKY